MSASDIEIAGIKSQLDDIVRNLKTDLQVWNKCHTSGWTLVNDMAKMHSRCLAITRNLHKHTTQRRINFEQQKLRLSRNVSKRITARLLHVVDRLLDSTEHTRESLQRLRKLCCASDHIFYRTWEFRDILEFAESVMRLYDAEYEIKEMVAEELTNCKDHEELQLIRQAWRTPRHALTSEFKSMFKQFEFETNEVKTS